ncbi:MAG: gephyrin-like molybdotransferase Glp [Bulleidia sp.]
MGQIRTGNNRFGYALLAGGAGTRLGCISKAEISFNGKTFLDHICSEMEKAGRPCYLSLANYKLDPRAGWRIVKDTIRDRNGRFAGPIGGIYSCLKQASADGLEGLFFAPCDAPFYKLEISDKLLDFMDDHHGAFLWRTENGRIQTTFGWYSVSILPAMEEEMVKENYKLASLAEKIHAEIIEAEDAGLDQRLFENINTRGSYRKIFSGEEDNYAESLELEDAVSMLRMYTAPVAEKEETDLSECTGRTLAEDIIASHDQPPFSRSPLDGYAFRAEDTSGASREKPVCLKVLAEVDAGYSYDGTIRAGEAVRIMTGAPIPAGADAVARQEDTDYGESYVHLYSAYRPYQNYCRQGEDYLKGSVLLNDGEEIGPAETGIIASTGRDRVRTYRKPRALVVSTGDEVVLPGQVLTRNRIFDSNLYTACAQLRLWGVEISGALHCGDQAEELAEMIRSRIEEADIVITIGGVSVGKKDILHEVYRILDVKKLIRKIRIKPGMAMLAGTFRDKMLISLSGNPYAAYTGLHLVVRPVIAALKGSSWPYLQKTEAVLMEEYGKKSPVRRFVRAEVINSRAYIEGHTGGNGDVYSGHQTNALIEIPAGSERIDAGSIVTAILL